MRIIITAKSVYGNTLIYPVCPQAHRFCELTGCKTLTANNLRTIRAMGFEVVQSTLPLAVPA